MQIIMDSGRRHWKWYMIFFQSIFCSNLPPKPHVQTITSNQHYVGALRCFEVYVQSLNGNQNKWGTETFFVLASILCRWVSFFFTLSSCILGTYMPKGSGEMRWHLATIICLLQASQQSEKWPNMKKSDNCSANVLASTDFYYLNFIRIWIISTVVNSQIISNFCKTFSALHQILI